MSEPAAAPGRATGGRRWGRAAAWLAFLAPFFYLTYGVANALAARRAEVPAIVFDWERTIPFWPWTIFPYWTINVFYGLSLFVAAGSRHELDRHAARLLSAQGVAVACFIAFPLAFSFGQPPVEGAPKLLFDALRSFDRPFNQAPSLHIALALILWDLYRRHLPRRWHPLLHGWTFAICASVLTTWQHHFIDIPTGALLGIACIWAWPLERRAAPAKAFRLSADPLRRRLALRYALGALAFGVLALRLGGAGLVLAWPAVALLLVALAYLGLGSRAFQLDARGRMGWAARWLLAPYRLGAYVNAWLWTRGAPAHGTVLPGISVGRLPRRGEPAPEAALLSLAAELQAPAGAAVRCLPLLDLVPPPPAMLRRAAAAIEALVRTHGAVRVCCALGYSRSAASLACWLVRSGRAADLDEATALLRRARPQLVLHAGWMQALRRAVQAERSA